MKVCKNPIIVAGLAGILALGAVGCSFSSESKSTVETSVSDGNTTTTTKTETTTSSENGTKTETNQTTTSNAENAATYTNEHFGVGFTTPEGFKVEEVTPDNEHEQVDFYAYSEEPSEVKFVIESNPKRVEGVTDEASWAKAYAESYAANMKEIGETNIEPSDVVEGKIGNLVCHAVHFDSVDKDGKEIHRDLYFVMDEDGDAMNILLRANKEETLQLLRQNMMSVNQ